MHLWHTLAQGIFARMYVAGCVLLLVVYVWLDSTVTALKKCNQRLEPKANCLLEVIIYLTESKVRVQPSACAYFVSFMLALTHIAPEYSTVLHWSKSKGY